jgi:hypothetical protein
VSIAGVRTRSGWYRRGSQVKCFQAPSPVPSRCCRYWRVIGKGRWLTPDIINATRRRVFEIKPVREAPQAVGQLWAYQAFLNAALDANDVYVKPGWWRLPWNLYDLSEAGPKYRDLKVLAFMFPGSGALAALPGIILYMVLRINDRRADKERAVEVVRCLFIAEALRRLASGPDLPIGDPEPGPSPDSQDPLPDGNGRWPPVPPDRIPDEEDVDPEPIQPPAQPPAQETATETVQKWVQVVDLHRPGRARMLATDNDDISTMHPSVVRFELENWLRSTDSNREPCG